MLDGGRAIQSKLDYEPDVEGWQGGVRVMPLVDVLETIMQTRVPADEYVDPAE